MTSKRAEQEVLTVVDNFEKHVFCHPQNVIYIEYVIFYVGDDVHTLILNREV